MPSNSIRYAGLKKLSVEDQDTLKRIMQTESGRITRLIKNVMDLTVTVKVHETGGVRKRYLIFLKAVSPSHIFAVQSKDADVKKSGEWDLALATRNAIDKLVSEIKHKLKIENESWKSGGIKGIWKKRLNE